MLQEDKDCFDFQAEHKSMAVKVRMTLSWFKIFPKAFSSHLAYQRFDLSQGWPGKNNCFWAWGEKSKKRRKAETQHEGSCSPTGFTPGIWAHQGSPVHTAHFRTLRQLPLKQPSTSHLNLNVEMVSGRCSCAQDLLTILLSAFQKRLPNEGQGVLKQRLTEMTTQQQPGFQGPGEPEEGLGRQEVAPTQHCLSQKNGTPSPSHGL